MMMRINLLPVRQAQKRTVSKQIIVLGVLLIVVTLIGNFFWYNTLDREAQRRAGVIADYQRRISELEKIIGEVNNINKRRNEVNDKLKILESLRKQRSGPVRMMDALASAMPRYVDLTEFDEKNGNVRISGRARTHEDVAELVTGLKGIVWTARGLGRVVEKKRDTGSVRVELLAHGNAMEDFPSKDVFYFFKNVEFKRTDQRPGEVSATSRGVDFELTLSADYAIEAAMDKILDQINKAPAAVKYGVLAGLVVLLTVANYFLLISDVVTKIANQKNEQSNLERTLLEKQAIADNLQEKRKEMDTLQTRLDDALNELPESKDLEELLAQLNDLGKKSGLEISSVQPGAESPSAFFARIPIRMTVSGNYHEIALFLQEISNMRRIVNVNNMRLGNGVLKNDKVMLSSEFLATTFRFLEASKPAEKK